MLRSRSRVSLSSPERSAAGVDTLQVKLVQGIGQIDAHVWDACIGPDQPFCIIGERINPTGRRIFQDQLRAGDLSAIERDVAAQVAGGAMVLDINMGVPLTDEPELLWRAVLRRQGGRLAWLSNAPDDLSAN